MVGEKENISTAATIHSSSESKETYIEITEKPINYFAKQIEFIKDTVEQVETTKYFFKTKLSVFDTLT